jgi:1-acyl-sn-glycerol-3-phosphate acyltransferase
MQGRALQRDNVNSTPLSDSVTAMIPSLRAGTLLAGFFALTLPLMPVQALLLRLGSRGKRPPLRHFPNWYHRTLCRLLGVRLHVDGALTPGTPTLLLSNHVSWLDIPVLSAMAPVSFVAKREVGTWPLVRTLARLQRTVFVDRERRLTVGVTTSEIEERLSAGDAVVLFAEGTSNDGNRVLPFRRHRPAAQSLWRRATRGRIPPRSAHPFDRLHASARHSPRPVPAPRYRLVW